MTIPSIGIACLHFSPRKEVTPSNWADGIKAGLEAVASIKNIEISDLGHFVSRFDPNGEDPEDLDGSAAYDFGVHPQSGMVAFTVSIPVRDQEKLNLFRGGAVASDETFRVVTMYSTSGPATLVHFNADLGVRGAGSQGVVIVREFLEREFRRADAGVDFLAIGPSPFHADVTVLVEDHANSQDGDFTVVRRERSAGYEVLEISCRESGSSLYEKLISESQFFYECVREQGRNLARANVVSDMAEDLIELYRRRGVRGFFKRLFNSRKQARELLIGVIQAKLAEARSVSEMRQQFEEYKNAGKISLFESKIAEEVTFNNGDQLASSEEVAKLLEGGAKKEFEIFVLSSSTLLGAAAGAVAAVLAK